MHWCENEYITKKKVSSICNRYDNKFCTKPIQISYLHICLQIAKHK